MVKKRYKLFGITVWEIEAELEQPAEDEVEDDEAEATDSTASLAAQIETNKSEPPMFGFTNYKEYIGDDDE